MGERCKSPLFDLNLPQGWVVLPGGSDLFPWPRCWPHLFLPWSPPLGTGEQAMQESGAATEGGQDSSELYSVLNGLGSGGYSNVLLARHTQRQDLVAMKVYSAPPPLACARPGVTCEAGGGVARA